MFSALKSRIESLAEKKLRVFAYILIAIAFIDFSTALVLFGSGLRVASYFIGGIAFGFAFLILPLLLSGHDVLARIITPYFAAIVLFFFGSYYGPASDPWTSIFIGAVYPFLVFSHHERRFQILTLFAPLLFYSGLVLTNYSFLRDAGIGVAWLEPQKYFSYTMNLCTFAIVAACSFLFSRQTQKYETLLQTAVADLTALRAVDSELNAQMSSLIAIICHDIANPLNVAIFNAEKLLLASPQERSLIKISQANGAILNIVQSVHRLQELRTGRIAVEECATRIEEVIIDCQNALDDALSAKRITLEVNIDPSLTDRTIIADQKVFTYSVLLNLLTNAIKHSPSGSIVRVKAKKVRQLAEITVSDSGPGIPKCIADRLFNLTENRSLRGSAGEIGSGFGLPIAKTCMALMLGEISFVTKTIDQDPTDHGTVFTLRLRCR